MQSVIIKDTEVPVGDIIRSTNHHTGHRAPDVGADKGHQHTDIFDRGLLRVMSRGPGIIERCEGIKRYIVDGRLGRTLGGVDQQT